MKQWEYLVLTPGILRAEEVLNKAGRTGWELVGVVSDARATLCLFLKRSPDDYPDEVEEERDP